MFLAAAYDCFPADGTASRSSFEVFERLVLEPFEQELRRPGRDEALHEEILGSPLRTFVTALTRMVPIVSFCVALVGDAIELLDLVCDYDNWHPDDEDDDLLEG